MATSSTSRRARLEEELGLLQQDVASLCSKLQRQPFAAEDDAARLSIEPDGEPSATERAIALLERAPPPPPRAGSGAGRLARLQRALDEMTRRRDEQACEVRRLRHEVDKAKGRSDLYAELKENHALLQEDYSSLQASLEASERIRAKQRDLLRSLQGDASVADDNASPLEDDRYERLMTGEESFGRDDESPSPPPPPRRAPKKVAKRRQASPARKASPAARRGVSPVARKAATRKVAARHAPPPPAPGVAAAAARPRTAAVGRRAAAAPPARRKAAAKPATTSARRVAASKSITKKAAVRGRDRAATAGARKRATKVRTPSR